MKNSEIIKMIEKYEDFARDFRRDLHTFPEIGWHEFRTSSKIAEVLAENNIPFLIGEEHLDKNSVFGYPNEDEIEASIKRALAEGAKKEYIDRMNGYTGLTAMIDSGKEGPVTAFRVDIDALPVYESHDMKHFPYAKNFVSKHEGWMHACGHDGHATIGLVTCLMLNEMKDSLKGKIKIIFQPAEEGVRGAYSVVKSGNLDDVDKFIGIHINNNKYKGSCKQKLFAATNSVGFLATTKLDINFTGVPSHAAGSPEKGKNALLAAATCALAIQTQTQDGRGKIRANVGKLEAGTGRNVIAANAFMMAETRGETTEISEDVFENVKNIIAGSAKMFGCDYSIDIMGKAETALSDISLRHDVDKIIRENLNEPHTEENSCGGSEDVTYMMNHVQKMGGESMHMYLCTDLEGSAHNSFYSYNENVLLYGAKILSIVANEINKI